MAELVLFDAPADPHPDPADVLLHTFYLRRAAHNATDAYTFSKNAHPVEFQIVSERAREHGHQFGVVGDSYGGRYELVLKGHHSQIVNGVCVGADGCATCVVIKYPTHNFSVENPIGFRVGGSGGLIKRAFRQGRRILENQQETVYNAALELCIQRQHPVRLYAFVGPERTGFYVYRGIFLVTGMNEFETDDGLTGFEFNFIPAPENVAEPQNMVELPMLEVEFHEEAPEEPLLLEWPQTDDENEGPGVNEASNVINHDLYIPRRRRSQICYTAINHYNPTPGSTSEDTDFLHGGSRSLV